MEVEEVAGRNCENSGGEHYGQNAYHRGSCPKRNTASGRIR